MLLENAEVHLPRERELPLRPPRETDATVVGEVRLLGDQPRPLDVDDALVDHHVDLGPDRQLGGAPHLQLPRAEGHVTGDAALGTTLEPPPEVGQVEVERDALVVEDELAAHDHEPLDRDLQAPASPAPAADLRDVVTPGTQGRRGEGPDAQAQALDAHAREDDAVAPQGCEARPDAHDRHFQERRRVGRRPAHPQAAQLDLTRGRPQGDRLDAHGPLEVAPEEVLDEPRPPVRRAPQRVRPRGAQDQREDEELAPAGHE